MVSSTRMALQEGGRTLVNQCTVPWHLATNMARGYWAGRPGVQSALHADLVAENTLLESTG